MSLPPAAAPAFTVRAAEPYAGGVEPWADAACERFYASAVGASSSAEHMLIARAAGSGEVVAACEGSSWFGGCYCSRLAVAPAWRRGRGVGSAMLKALEREARDGPARAGLVYLCTLDFQDGPAVYPRMGFAAGNVVRGLPGGRVVTYFSRPIVADDEEEEEVAPAAASSAPATEFVIESLHAPAGGAALAPEELEARQAAAQGFLRATFVQQSLAVVGRESGYFAYALEAVEGAGSDGAETRIGALTGYAFWGMLLVSLLIVEEPRRSRGVGSALLEAAQQLGRERGCTRLVVETMSFQAPDFYKKHGFAEVARVPGWRQGAELIRFEKALGGDAAAEVAAAAKEEACPGEPSALPSSAC